MPPPERKKAISPAPVTTATTSKSLLTASVLPASNIAASADNDDDDGCLFSKTELAQMENARETKHKAYMTVSSSLFDDGDDPPPADSISLDATDEEVHQLSLKCRLSGTEAQTARLKELAQAGHWYAELCYARLCDIGAPFVPKDPSVLKAYLEKDPTSLLLAKAANDNLYAQFALGFVYSEEGALYNAAEAVKYHTLAAERGHVIAQRYLYLCHVNGYHGLSVNKQEAIKWLQMSSDQGYAAAQYSLGTNYTKGKCGLAKDVGEGVRLYKLAAQQGFADAEFSLARAYSKGVGGLKTNDTKAVKYYERAAMQGNTSAQFNLANAYAANTDGIKKKQLSDQDREATANGWYKMAAEGGHVNAMVKVGHNYLQLKKLSEASIEWSRRAGESKKHIAKLIREAEEEERHATEWFQRAAKEGNTEGLYHAAMASRNLDEKLNMLNQAAEQKYADAYFQLGHCYQHGVGVPVNTEEAIKWYKMKVDDEVASGESGKGAAAECIKAMTKKGGGLFGFFK